MAAEASTVGIGHPPQCGPEDSGDKWPDRRSVCTHESIAAAHPPGKRLNEIANQRVHMALEAAVKYVWFSEVGQALYLI